MNRNCLRKNRLSKGSRNKGRERKKPRDWRKKGCSRLRTKNKLKSSSYLTRIELRKKINGLKNNWPRTKRKDLSEIKNKRN